MEDRVSACHPNAPCPILPSPSVLLSRSFGRILNSGGHLVSLSSARVQAPWTRTECDTVSTNTRPQVFSQLRYDFLDFQAIAVVH